MSLHPTTFGFLTPTDEQKRTGDEVRQAAKAYADALEALLPDGPDKDHILRSHRTNAMWALVSLTRLPDGTPRI